MAQETAGTIGIPVLKNEILPYLTDFAKRRERAELYKQKAEQRAAELEAKKAAEVDKYIPPAFEISKGGYWQPAIKRRMEAEQKSALDRISAATTQAEKAKAAQDYNTIIQELNYGGELETTKQKENLKSLQESGYAADENALARYYKQQADTNPDFRNG
jgi:type I restriction-modification system DNA methylase subunit